MSISTSARRAASTMFAAALLLGGSAAQAVGDSRYAGVGRPASPAEIAAWNIDVRPDFAGLPAGAGSVARGQEIWDAQCASCHGSFGESNETFNPIIGGTIPAEAREGRVKSLTTSELQRTTMMKLSSLATLWDYIRRAMPWNAPKSLSPDDVYAVSAYILHLADLVPASFVLSAENIRETEKLLPNRNGMNSKHGLWRTDGRADVKNQACMRSCATSIEVRSVIPDYARNAHGNLALQNRDLGGTRGADTTRAAPVAFARAQTPGSRAPAAAATIAGPAHLAAQQGCMACHGIDRKVVGPGFREVAARYGKEASDPAAIARLAERIRSGGSGNWGAVPMPPQAQLDVQGASELAQWIAGGAQ